jgi:hypothetical protein
VRAVRVPHGFPVAQAADEQHQLVEEGTAHGVDAAVVETTHVAATRLVADRLMITGVSFLRVRESMPFKGARPVECLPSGIPTTRTGSGVSGKSG